MSGTHTKQMPCNKTIKLIWRRDLQREQTCSFMTPFFPLPSLPLPLTLFPKTFHTKFSKNIYIPHYHVSCEPVVFPLHVWYRSKGLCAIGKWSFTVVTYIMRKIENFWRIVFCCWGVCLPQGLWECLSISGQVWPWVMRIWKTKRSFMFLQLIWRFLCFLTGYISEVTKHYFGDSVIRKQTHSVWESLELCTRTLAAVSLSLSALRYAFLLFSNV